MNFTPMTTNPQQSTVTINLSEQEALVLVHWLGKVNQQDILPQLEHPAEQRVLFDLEAVLERALPVMLSADYKQQLKESWEKVGD